MIYSIVEHGPVVVVSLDGLVNYASSADFKRLMADIAPFKGRKIVFDLGRIHHVDSVGLGFLYVARDELGRAFPLGLKSPNESVRKLLELTESYTDFDIQP
ncbi:MAG TPA: STAS domain-containing protein [Candidatus Sulfotelmatobacter sp.]|jgi:anti-sigma B factor antagonist|nr:STAS domain-containing protein [Candidatus Sulfotelmatobacter sp.]